MKLEDALRILDGDTSVIPRRPSTPPPDHRHLDEDDVWTLAGYDRGPLPDRERLAWERALACGECFNRVARLRHILRRPEAYGAPLQQAPAAEIQHAWEGLQLRIGLEWLKMGLLAGASKKAVRVRGAVRTRGGPAAGKHQLVQQLGAFTLTVTVEQEDPKQGRFTLQAHVTAEPGYDTLDLAVRLVRKGMEPIVQPLQGKASVTFATLELSEYFVELLPATP